MRARLLQDVRTELGIFAAGTVVDVVGPDGPAAVQVIGAGLGYSRVCFRVPVRSCELVADPDDE